MKFPEVLNIPAWFTDFMDPWQGLEMHCGHAWSKLSSCSGIFLIWPGWGFSIFSTVYHERWLFSIFPSGFLYLTLSFSSNNVTGLALGPSWKTVETLSLPIFMERILDLPQALGLSCGFVRVLPLQYTHHQCASSICPLFWGLRYSSLSITCSTLLQKAPLEVLILPGPRCVWSALASEHSCKALSYQVVWLTFFHGIEQRKNYLTVEFLIK